MGTVFRKTITRSLPADAEIIVRNGERFARWKPAKGKTRTEPVIVGQDGTDRIATTAATFTAKYRDGAGVVREVSTGCRDEQAARRILADLERRAELVKAGVMTAAEDAVADHQATALADHFAAYIAHQKAKGLNATRIRNTDARLKRLANDCGFRRLADLHADALQRWLVDRAAEDMSAGNRNEYRQELVGFGNWCVKTRRLVGNPFADVPKADAKADQRRHRRSLTEDELRRLVYVATLRPLAEYGRETVRKPKSEQTGRQTWEKAALTFDTLAEAAERGRYALRDNPAFLADLEHAGRERALVYKALVLTGLRKGELASLTVGQMELDGAVPFATLNASDEKNRQGNSIPLRADLAADLREWLDLKLHRERADALRTGQPVPTRLPAASPVFNVPAGLVRILDRDLNAAGIPKRDERGRTVDVHALRHSFGTLLSRAGVAPRTAQAAMRHSSIDLTMNTYTDPKLLDVHGALDALPAFPLDTDPRTERIAVKATGTDPNPRSLVAPTVAPAVGNRGLSQSFPDQSNPERTGREHLPALAVSDDLVKRKDPLTSAVSGSWKVERKGVEPSTSALRTQRSPN